jgi:hypothetical protein
MIGWFSATVATLAVTGFFASLTVPVMVRLILAAIRRWPQLSGWNPLVTLSVVVLAPLMAGFAIGLGAFWPGLLGHFLHFCHCGTETLLTEHSSVLHPELSVSLLPFSTLLLVALLIRPLGVLISSWSAPRMARRDLLNQEDFVSFAGLKLRLLRMGNANAFTAGFFRPVIHVDRSWWHSLTDQERGIVAAHEGCHQRYCDPLVLMIARLAFSPLPATSKAEITSLVVLQMETRADMEATNSTSDAISVADFLLRTYRGSPGRSYALAFVGSTIERRIRTLLDSADGRHSKGATLAQWFSVAAVSGTVALTFIFRGLFHQGAEFILGLI